MALEGLGFGMMPELQVEGYLDTGKLVDAGHFYHLDVPLYWHYWQTESAAMATLRNAVSLYARQVLR
jgi:LysR family transcriptional regulator (chromosome initiation inhibitor)